MICCHRNTGTKQTHRVLLARGNCEKQIEKMEYKDRFLKAMLVCMDMTRGTLWRVEESVWMRNVKDYVDSGRKCHVGLSIRKRPLQSVADMIPMLIGTSRRGSHSAFHATGCFDDSDDQATFFRLRPFQIPLSHAYDKQRGVMIKPNPPKRRLDADELVRLDAMLAAKGAAS